VDAGTRARLERLRAHAQSFLERNAYNYIDASIFKLELTAPLVDESATVRPVRKAD
jgi:hypothetical protein